MKYKIWSIILLIFFWFMYGIVIGDIIFTGFEDGWQITMFILITIQVVFHTIGWVWTLLEKEA